MTRLSFLLTLCLCGAASAQATDAPFKLILRATEQKIQKGEVSTAEIVKSWKLPAAGVAASKKHSKISTTLSPVLDKMFDQINARAPAQPASGTWADRGWRPSRPDGSPTGTRPKPIY